MCDSSPDFSQDVKVLDYDSAAYQSMQRDIINHSCHVGPFKHIV